MASMAQATHKKEPTSKLQWAREKEGEVLGFLSVARGG